jgi:PhnB protein
LAKLPIGGLRCFTMSAKIKPIPDGYHTLTPYLIIKGAAVAIEFYKKAFGAQEQFRMPGPDGKTIGHANIVIGDSIVMLADEAPQMIAFSPSTLKGTPVTMVLYVEDADTVFKRAVDAGATVRQPLEDKFYGDRAGTIVDPFGHIWTIMTHVEDVTPEMMDQRVKELYQKMARQKA